MHGKQHFWVFTAAQSLSPPMVMCVMCVAASRAQWTFSSLQTGPVSSMCSTRLV